MMTQIYPANPAATKETKIREEIAKNTLRLEIEGLERRGWRVIAAGYSPPEEWMLENCVADLMGLSWSGHPVEFRIVRTDFHGAYVFRRNGELKEAE